MKTRELLTISLTLLTACGTDFSAPGTPNPPPTEVPPPSLKALSSQFLSGASGEYLSDPLVVQVRRSETPMSGVNVAWIVEGGQGQFAKVPGAFLSPATTLTDSEGIARIYFRPMSEGALTVTAIIGWPNATTSFAVSVSHDRSVIVVNFGPVFDCYGTPNNNDPSIFNGPKDSVPVGILLEFVYAPYLPACSADVVSVSVPSGGTPFDSGIIPGGGQSTILLDVAGDWTFVDRLNGGGVTVKVR
jgi:hypothetical protein